MGSFIWILKFNWCSASFVDCHLANSSVGCFVLTLLLVYVLFLLKDLVKIPVAKFSVFSVILFLQDLFWFD